MNQGPEADALHLDRILERISSIRRSLAGTTLDAFRNDRDKVDVTAFRLGHIGEASRKLSAELRARHDHIPWERIYRRRNIVVHAYDSIDAETVWAVTADRLDDLAAACRTELERFGP